MPMRRFSTLTLAFLASHRQNIRNECRWTPAQGEMKKNSFFHTFKAGMLLKTNEGGENVFDVDAI